MQCQIEEAFLRLCEQSPCIIILPLQFESEDTIVCLDMNINMEAFENSYWGRQSNDRYCYQICRF